MSFNIRNLEWSDVRNFFRKWRDENERRSSDVVFLWEAVLQDRVHKTGQERYLILEQVTIAALDTGRFDIAGECFKELSKTFPGSLRVRKLKAMRLEAMGNYESAIKVLDAIIEEDETNAAARKRKVAVLLASGQRKTAIKELVDYLNIFMSDQEAWLQLCNMYLAESQFGKAAFCIEEVLLHNPFNHLLHQKLADIRYTMGGLENCEIARTYYAQAIKLNPKNVRALYGMYLCCSQISNSKSITASKRKDAQKLAQWALEEATERTKNAKNNKEAYKLLDGLAASLGQLEIKAN